MIERIRPFVAPPAPTRRPRVAGVAAAGLLALLVTGCGASIPTGNAAASVGSHRAGDAAPLPVDDYRRARLATAMAGLLYEEDRVVVETDHASALDDVGASQAALVRGEGLLDAGDNVAAIGAFTQAVIAAPRTVPPYVALARGLITKGRTPEARAAVQTALALEPNHLEARWTLGTIHERLGDRDAAIETYDALTTLAPDHGAAHGRLAALHYLLGNQDAARIHGAAAQRVGTVPPARLVNVLAGHAVPSVVVRPRVAGGGGPTIGGQTRIDTGAGSAQSNETTGSAASPAPGVVVAGWNDYRTPIRNGFGVTLDGGATWTDFVVRPPVANQGATEGDPMTAYDHRTGTLWVGGVSFTGNGGIFVARKQPGSATFEPSVMTLVSGGADKVWMAAGRPPSTPNATHLYVAYNLGLQTSTDLGDSWGPARSLGSGIGFLPRIGPLGEVHVGYWDFGAGVRLRTSLDGGATVGPSVLAATRMEIYDTFNTPHLPGSFRAPPLNYLAVDPNTGRLYFVWFDTTSVAGGETEVDLYINQSDDGGATWSVPAVFSLPGDQFMPWLEVDDSGRLHLVYLDTRNTPQNDADANAFIDVYYAYSEDSGATWTEARLTPAPWNSAFANSGGSFIGDYLGMAVAANQVYPIYLSTQNGTDLDIFTNVISHPTSALFADGFESGNTTAWDVTVP